MYGFLRPTKSQILLFMQELYSMVISDFSLQPTFPADCASSALQHIEYIRSNSNSANEYNNYARQQ